MKKLFISQPMRNKTDEEILSERETAINQARNYLGEDIEVLDTFFKDFDGNPLEFIGKSIIELAKADAVYFASGWFDYRGCRIERMCAKEYGIPIIECLYKEVNQF